MFCLRIEKNDKLHTCRITSPIKSSPESSAIMTRTTDYVWATLFTQVKVFYLNKVKTGPEN